MRTAAASPPRHRYQWRIDTPVGPLRLLSDGERLTRLDFLSDGVAPPRAAPDAALDDAPFRAVIDEMEAYFAGALRAFSVPLALGGTAFQVAVWEQLTRIPFGATTSYADIAARVGSPKGVRAVGQANGRNPIPIIVPCHRVITSDGKLGGWSGGLGQKQWLLDHERAHAPLFR